MSEICSSCGRVVVRNGNLEKRFCVRTDPDKCEETQYSDELIERLKKKMCEKCDLCGCKKEGIRMCEAWKKLMSAYAELQKDEK